MNENKNRTNRSKKKTSLNEENPRNKIVKVFEIIK